jgi:hypothetical protein
MSLELPAVARRILDTLLDRVEQPGRRKAVRVRLDANRHHEYFSDLDVRTRRQTNAALTQLEAQGVLRLHWRRWEEGNWLDAVDLAAGRGGALYALLGRVPRPEQQAQLHELLAAQTPRACWHSDFLSWVGAQLEKHRSIAPLDVRDQGWNRDLLRALEAIADLRAPTLERSLSVRLFGRSKRLEELRAAIITVLRRHDPAASVYGEDTWALLRAHNLDRAPEYLPVAGPLVLRLNGRLLDLTVFTPSVALSAAMLREAEVAECRAVSLVTVENATSFNELIAVRPPQTLAVYIGGFASPAALGLLKQIRAASAATLFSHWGDLDAGGLRILAHLREQAGVIRPVAMDAETLESHRAHAQPLTLNDREALRRLRALPLLSDCARLIDRLLAANLKLEQEAVSAALLAQNQFRER